MTDEHKLRCGDRVLHKPTGETWLLAYADYESGDLAWLGWPDGRARIEDCALKVACDDEAHFSLVGDILSAALVGDSRQGVVRRLYGSDKDTQL